MTTRIISGVKNTYGRTKHIASTTNGATISLHSVSDGSRPVYQVHFRDDATGRAFEVCLDADVTESIARSLYRGHGNGVSALRDKYLPVRDDPRATKLETDLMGVVIGLLAFVEEDEVNQHQIDEAKRLVNEVAAKNGRRVFLSASSSAAAIAKALGQDAEGVS